MADAVGTLRVLLEADASEFDKAIKEASSDIADLAKRMRKDLEPSARAVNTAVRDFLGGPEIKRAQTYAAAIGKIGDVSKLTAADQKKVNQAVTEAIAHYKLLGMQAPKNLTDIQKATHGAASSMSGIGSSLKGLAATIGITFSAGAVIGFAKSVFDTASSIDDMSKRLGVSAEFAQRFKFALEQTGSSLEAGERALGIMNRTLAEGSKSTVGALSAMGLKLADIRSMRPEDAFKAIAAAAGQIEDPMKRAQVMQDLFGRGAIELMPLVVEGYENVASAATVMSDETVKKLADAQDAWEALFNKVTIISGEIIADIMSASDGAGAMSSLVAGYAGTTAQAMEDMASATRVASGQVRKDVALVDESIKKVDKSTAELSDAQKKAKAEAEAYRKRIQGIADVLTGKKLATEIKELADAVKLAGGESGVTAHELGELATKIDQIQQKGGKLTPELEAIRTKFMFFRDMVASTRIEFERLNGAIGRDGEMSRRMGFFQNIGPLQGGVNGLLPGLNPAQMAGKPLNDWREGLSDLVEGFEDLASIAGDTTAGITRGIGSGLSATLLFGDGMKQIGEAKTFTGILSGLGSVVGALGQGIGLAIELGKALHDAFTRSEAEKAASDIRRNFGVDVDENSQVAKDIEQMVQDRGIDRNLAIELHLPDIIKEGGGVTAENFASFRDRANELFDDIALGGREGDLALQALDDTLGELGKHVVEQGGVWDQHFVAMLQRAQAEGHELASVMELVKGQLDIAGGGLNRVVSGFVSGIDGIDKDAVARRRRIREIAEQRGRLHDTGAGGIDEAEINALDKEWDQLKAQQDQQIADIKKQMQAITAERSKIQNRGDGADEDQALRNQDDIDDLDRRWDELNGRLKGITGEATAQQQGEFDRLSRIALATFNAYIQNGQNAADAITAVGPSIDQLKQATQDFGFAGNEAFNQLVRWRDLVSANQPVLDSLAGLNEMMVALSNVGALTQDTFTDLQVQAHETFADMQEGGFTQQEALAQMVPTLETLRELHKDRGLAISEETQALIDQAEEQGVLAQEQLSTNDILMQGIGALIQALGGDLPAEWRKMVDDAERAAKDVESAFKDVDIDIPVDFDVGDIDMPRIEVDVPGAAKGAFVPKRPGGTLVRVGEGQHDEWIVPQPDLAALMNDWASGPSLPSLSMAGSVAGVERHGGASGSSGNLGTVILEMDGRQVARGVFPFIPDEAQRFQVGVR